MSILKVTDDDVERFQLIATPNRTYISSSAGVTGSVSVYRKVSTIQKVSDPNEVQSVSINGTQSSFDEYKFVNSMKSINASARTLRDKNNTKNINSLIEESSNNQRGSLFDLVKKQTKKANKSYLIERITPTNDFTKYTLCKNNVKDILSTYYKPVIRNADWSYTNYHSLNFFKAGDGHTSTPDNSVLLYPNFVRKSSLNYSSPNVYCSGTYHPTTAFSFCLNLNARYKSSDKNFLKAGTILHLSSTYALSLITGSAKDEYGNAAGFRLLLQLSHSADIPPSLATPGVYPNDLIYLSDDNSIKWNNWHNVTVTCTSERMAGGNGFFYVDGVNVGTFDAPNKTLVPNVFKDSENPSFLAVGNFYEGNNTGDNRTSRFFTALATKNYGVPTIEGPNKNDNVTEPVSFVFDHPLKAEIHNLSVRNTFLSSSTQYNRNTGPTNQEIAKDYLFYLPPFFVERTPVRFVKDGGNDAGIFYAPTKRSDGTSGEPFNTTLALDSGVHLINLENFVKDFGSQTDSLSLQFPRCLNLAPQDVTPNNNETAQEWFYSQPAVKKRNLSILPNDDGNFDPNYSILDFSDSVNYDPVFGAKYSRYVTDKSKKDLSVISLTRLVNDSSINVLPITNDANLATLGGTSSMLGQATLSAIKKVEDACAKSSEPSIINQEIRKIPTKIGSLLKDASSNQITIFNISNLYYGGKILPGSFTITDNSLSGSYGAVSITLKDDAEGCLYRADSATAHYQQNIVGNIFYDEGIIVIKNPHLNFFGKHQFEISFRGMKTIHSTKYEILADAGLLNSSSNASHSKAINDGMTLSNVPSDEESFVYISGMYFHDENMNVVAKAHLAQPIVKRESDKILFKVAFDY